MTSKYSMQGPGGAHVACVWHISLKCLRTAMLKSRGFPLPSMMFFAFFVAFLSLRDVFVTSTPLPFESNAANLAVSGGSNAQPLACPTDDNQRSVQDIVWGCLATIFACSWLAVHPNIPSANAKWWRTGLIRLELMLWTILSPEFVIYWAIRQWIGARQIQKRYKGTQYGALVFRT
jgi:hypothetical protein